MRRHSIVVLAVSLVMATRALAQVSGIVTDLATGLPLSGADVTVQTTTQTTTTDTDGTFAIVGAIGTDLVVVAAKRGYFNASVFASSPATSLAIAMELVPQTDDPTYTLASPLSCGFCHPTQYEEWTDSPMANGGINAWVYDIYDGSGTLGGLGGFVYTRDSIFAEDNPASECASCHQPEPWVGNPFSALEPLDQLSPGALHGVSCDVCHKIANVNVPQITFPGIYPGVVEFTRPAAPDYDPVVYGVLKDTNFEAGIMRPSYQPQLVAEVCGACHQDANDYDADGDYTDPGSIESEPTYLEWANSAYGDPASPNYATCVDCHMPPSGVDRVCDVLSPPLLRDPGTIRTHRVLGSTPEYLENSVELTMATAVDGSTLDVTVNILNDRVGHHVPTGVTVRNMVLVVEAIRQEDGYALADDGAQVVHDLGGVGDPQQGYYAGLPGKFFGKVNHAANGSGPTFFTDATGIQFDSRIPALATDTTSYHFAIPENGGTIAVWAHLIYRRAFRALVDAKGWQYDGHGNPLDDVQPPYYGHLMASRADVVALPYTPPMLLRGDVDGDGQVQLNDAIVLLAYEFQGGAEPSCLDASDCDDGGEVDLADAVYLLSYLFVAGPAPATPGPISCGLDGTPDELPPCVGSSCF